jgi:hypothetical protein
MRLPIQSNPVMRSKATAGIARRAIVTPQGCSIGDQFKCVAEAAGVAAACATVETGVGVIACMAAAGGFVADCYDCAAAAPLKGAICAAADLGEHLGISIPSSVKSWCHL